MNEHIELVKKWLADPESVSLAELEANYEAVRAAAASAYAVAAEATAIANATDTASQASRAAAESAYADAAAADRAAWWVERYEKLTGD